MLEFRDSGIMEFWDAGIKGLKNLGISGLNTDTVNGHGHGYNCCLIRIAGIGEFRDWAFQC